jgi:hypothetical protein
VKVEFRHLFSLQKRFSLCCMIPERKNHKCFFVVRHPVLVKIIGTSNSHVRNIQKILKCLTVNKGNNKITELRTILQRESRSVNLTSWFRIAVSVLSTIIRLLVLSLLCCMSCFCLPLWLW